MVDSDERITFDGYDNQPVTIWDDFHVTDFITRFRPQGTYRILNPHPKKIAQQAKNSRVILTNAVNIINGVQPHNEFSSGLAETYEDRKSRRPAYVRLGIRFPMILCVHEDDFNVLLNKGFANNDMSAIKSMMMFAHVLSSMKSMAQRLNGAAKESVLLDFSRPALDAVKKIDESHDAKTSDFAMIPAGVRRLR